MVVELRLLQHVLAAASVKCISNLACGDHCTYPSQVKDTMVHRGRRKSEEQRERGRLGEKERIAFC